ncbi:MAG: hypothetical protein Q8865_09415 [Bacillota bacterium]|nr:hypothetical protein [Bacillota bacterium]
MRQVAYETFLSFMYIAILMVLLIACSADNIKYSSGIDTVHSYGDGEFQIAKISYSLLLSDEKYSACLVDEIKKYKKIDKYLYVLGVVSKTPVFVIADTQSNTSKLYILSDSTFDSLFINGKEKMLKDGAITAYSGIKTLNENEKSLLKKMFKGVDWLS